MSLLMGEWKHLRRTPPGGVPADAPASPTNHLHLRALPGRESKSSATGDGPPSFFSSALPLLEPPIETPLPLPAPPLNPRRARGRASIDAVTALTELKRSLDFDVSEERGSASRVAGGRSRTSRRPREDMNAAMMPLLATVPTAAGPGAPKALPELPKDIEEMSYRELKDHYPLVFGKATNSNNKGWLYRVIKARYMNPEVEGEEDVTAEEDGTAAARPRRRKRVDYLAVLSAGAA